MVKRIDVWHCSTLEDYADVVMLAPAVHDLREQATWISTLARTADGV